MKLRKFKNADKRKNNSINKITIKKKLTKIEDKTKNESEKPTQPKPLKRINPVENLLVWAKCKGFGWLPGRIANRGELSGPIDPPDDPTRWVRWFEDGKFTETHVDLIAPFHDFTMFFREALYQRRPGYKDAVDSAIKEAAKRAKKKLSNISAGIEWAKNEFWPEGHMKILPPNTHEADLAGIRLQDDRDLEIRTPNILKNDKAPTKKVDAFSEELESELLRHRNKMIEKVNAGLLDIEQVCLGCGSLDIQSGHPLFSGGICGECKIDFKEHAYMFDEAGFFSYCGICVGGEKILLCDNEDCGRVFCTVCLEMFLGENTFKKERQQKKWPCLLCRSSLVRSCLKRRKNWQELFHEFICQDDEIGLKANIVPRPEPIERSKRRPIKVLSLFDGIGTGYIALKELGFEISEFYASEIDMEAMSVVQVHFPEVIQIGDVQKINNQQLLEYGPFDLLIGGSPCNELSIVNPARKGLWSDKGTGQLFFEYYRILQTCQLMALENKQPFFWLFENVVCMDIKTRETINHFLQTTPVIIDAKDVSPARRPRMFWGNLPGMRRPIVPKPNYRLTLQECLEQGRHTNLSKANTITTNASTIRCMASDILQRDVSGTQFSDSLWSVEIERVFGFPDHYTDVNNLSRGSRQRILGKAWSVPVIEHLFSPLRDFYIQKS